MTTRSESGQTNLVAIGILVGVVITGVWVWKRLSFDTQDYVIDQAIPMAFVGLVIAAGLFLLVRAFNRLSNAKVMPPRVSRLQRTSSEALSSFSPLRAG